jgi:hypothetical protein
MSDDTPAGRTQEVEPHHTDVLHDEEHDDQTAAEAAEQADPGVTAAETP